MLFKTLHIISGFILIVFLFFTISAKAVGKDRMKIDLSQVKDSFIVSSIYIVGNFKTKPSIINNELLFQQYSTIQKNQLDDLVEQSKQNLENTSLFNYVYISYWFEKPEEVILEIKVEERWYSWFLPLFEVADRNFSAFLNDADLNRINYGVFFKQENFRGLNEVLKLKIRTGYVQEIDLLYQSAEYNNKIGWGSTLSYNAMNEISYQIYNNEATYISTGNAFLAQEYSTDIFLHYRHNFHHRHKLYLGYNHYRVQDTIAVLNPDYLKNGKSTLSYLSLDYQYKFDRRDSKYYPLKGTMWKAELTQYGLGILQSEIQNTSLELEFSQHGNLANKFYYAYKFNALANSNKNNPYVISNGYGWDDFIDGYEYNVIECDNYAFSKQKILYELIPTTTKQLKFIHLSQFSKLHYALYLKTYFNYGYVYKKHPNSTNSLTNNHLYSCGLGLDLVTYYDKVISLNYSINKAGQGGFYIHLNVTL